eukprot:2359404-Pyramimonas_sp.AAC.1
MAESIYDNEGGDAPPWAQWDGHPHPLSHYEEVHQHHHGGGRSGSLSEGDYAASEDDGARTDWSEEARTEEVRLTLGEGKRPELKSLFCHCHCHCLYLRAPFA